MHNCRSLLTTKIITAIRICAYNISCLLQNDIKRVIAYSTCSQMGYLFMAVGISQYSVALFHLVNHANYKEG
ncbi:BZ3500_MvSof-1268-A1-R1_C041g00089 [Microbotryum saponariae]|uniref:BZ3500_MvSof-1268-A1-R1_C041g00089 protein n=1 Tax=Microbotryum saponariae TaxID=289078 RepID=A0A2X0KNP5_9BASI|nr:BZ3500_MvSof-1268-A1-R1_C042g00098 [Microbotryum saponariae]SCZ95439.1 BZ3500_MvSof-1268-A1-R1_C041g00089 [Microbotryum saponariae]